MDSIKLLKDKRNHYIYVSNLYYNENAKKLYEKLGYKVFKEESRKEIS